ncbi:hypothetical protein BAE44_0022011 [Dichanthelium oligosanthes]|uniref:Uncharacterized protein n=1 Tax=Dichanthelium oligosanthes TaxID=888268 RepID=A0A1E5UVT3_9POAL|nr:hypothetical protein BAE44_0022011 [Dichanthelium oligosanthes]
MAKREAEEAADGGGASELLHHDALLVVGLTTASMAIALVAGAPPPPGLDRSAYFLALSWLFLAGVAELYAAAWISGDPRGRRAAGRKLVYASIAPLLTAVVICSLAATTILLR